MTIRRVCGLALAMSVFLAGCAPSGSDEQLADATSDAGSDSTSAPGPQANRAPIATADTATASQNSAGTNINVLANDSDPDGDTITLDSFDATTGNNGTVARDARGTPQDNSDDQLVYTPAPNFTGTDSFTYVISDTAGLTATGNVTVTVGNPPATNQAPVATNKTFTVVFGKTTAINVLQGATDADGDTITLESAGTGGQSQKLGTVAINQNSSPNDKSDDFVEYTPQTNTPEPRPYQDSFQYTISDGTDTASATVTLNVVDETCNKWSDQLAAGNGVCFTAYFCSNTPFGTLGNVQQTSRDCSNTGQTDATKILMKVFLPHPSKLDYTKGMPLIIHGHGFGGSRHKDLSHPLHHPDLQAAKLLWEQGYFVISFTQRGFGGGDQTDAQSENVTSGGRIGIMTPTLEGYDMNELIDWAIKHIRGNTGGAPISADPAKLADSSDGDSVYHQWFVAAGADPNDRVQILEEKLTAKYPASDPLGSRPSLLRSDLQGLLETAENPDCAVTDPDSNPATPPPIDDLPDQCDPAIGTVGYSYGGGFQYTLARSAGIPGRWGGERVDAMVPHGTWFDLRSSLSHNNVPKTFWVNALTAFAGPPPGGGGNREALPDELVQARSDADAVNQVRGTLANVPFRSNTPVDYCGPNGLANTDSLDRPVRSTADVLHMQGYLDTLFNFNEGYDNVMCYRRSGRDARMIQLTGGHPMPGFTKSRYTGQNTSMDIDEVIHCGIDSATGKPKRFAVKQMMVNWFEEKLRGQTNAAADIPDVCIVAENTVDNEVLVDSNYSFGGPTGSQGQPAAGTVSPYPKEGVVYQDGSTTAIEQVLVGAFPYNGSGIANYVCENPANAAAPHVCNLGAAADVFYGSSPGEGPGPTFRRVYTVSAAANGNTPTLAGIPLVTLEITTDVPEVDPLFFVGLGVRRTRGGQTETILVHEQLTAIRPGGGGAVTRVPWADDISIGTPPPPVDDGVVHEFDGNDLSPVPLQYGCEPNTATKRGGSLCASARLAGVGMRLLDGDEVGLLIYSSHRQYSSNNSKSSGQVSVTGTLELPMLPPSPLPACVNPSPATNCNNSTATP